MFICCVIVHATVYMYMYLFSMYGCNQFIHCMSIQIIYPNLEKKKILKNQQGSLAYIGLG